MSRPMPLARHLSHAYGAVHEQMRALVLSDSAAENVTFCAPGAICC